MRIHPPHAPSRIHTPGLTIYTCFTPPSYPPAATRCVQRGSIRSARVVEKPRDGAQREPSRFAPVADALAGPTQVAASDCARPAPAPPALGFPRPLVQRLASAAQPVAGVRALDEPPDGLLHLPRARQHLPRAGEAWHWHVHGESPQAAGARCPLGPSAQR